ncbi:hypothetical protein BAS09_11410 [Elizabethkingia ursingii]|jgi:hypothetical protein|uniref:Beta-carotene 15,15'-monooxygenase n=1 Tax=Elizabethkingia ursingii TaxID=1756150 RepID=A0ABX3NBU9_9FLAO|nr:DUF6427 family protein [Elizabethkingia ursingii]MDR2229753.1 DUF6427 family protein [Flavobacteriaceae bacterium]KUY25628.1 hypothetical protein ATB96_08275 [Elizabethkingia ursingii]MCL1670278.1 DUF6427 family protein [Elizabethkingia ursingii]OPB93346.1 hypothetical protein BB021_02870 [Elizabethkingia ursingii]OPC02317.1 hypothetical protein BAS09_11410 [Elizabethkingia ursingii]
MFRLLSKQTNIFSIPAYLVCLLVFISLFNILNFNLLSITSSIIAFLGIALGYFLFNNIGLNRNTHLPLFIYTILVFSFYFGDVSFPLAFTILTANLSTLILISNNEKIGKRSYFLVGCLMGFMYVVMPQTWPLIIFIILHIFATSGNISANLFRLFFGILLLFVNYAGLYYLLDIPDYYTRLIPYVSDKMITNIDPLIFLSPVVLFLLYSIYDHFVHFSKKSPSSKFRYTLLLVYSVSILIILIFYMGTQYEFLLLIAFPVSVITSRGLRFISKYWVKELILWGIIIFALLFKLAYYF